MRNKEIYIISSVIFVVLIAYIANNEINARKNAFVEVERHAKVIAESLWNFDRIAPRAYVEQAIRNNEYGKFTIKTDSGRVLISIKGQPIHNFADRVFDFLKLIPETHFSKDVVFNGAVIGTIEISARIKTIYSNIYAVLTGLLTLLAAVFFFKTLRSNRELDYRVHERTRALEDEIKERKKMEETLRESEEKFRLIFENSPMAFVHIDREGIVATCNDNTCKMLGSTRESLTGLDIKKDLKDKKMIDVISKALSGKNSYFKGEYVPVSGTLKLYLEAYFGPIFSIDGSLLGAIGILADISERKKTENELIKEKAFTEKVINSMPGIFYAFDENRKLVKWNKNLEVLLGRSEEEILNGEVKLLRHIANEDRKKISDELKKTRLNGQNISMEIRIIAADGSKIPMFCTASFIRIGRNSYLLGVGIDISDKKRLEAELQQSQKMEAIGTLAGGIAHDFNNILSAILGYAELAREDMDNPENLLSDLEEVFRGAGRAKDLVKQILTFSRKNDHELQSTHIQLVIKEAMKLIRSSIPATIEIKQDIDSECEPVMADPTLIHQIIMNLCTNSYHAMREKGGILGVSLKSVELTSDFVDNKINLSKGKYLKLEVSDTGSGIPKEEHDRIFDPYYTTKPLGEGTGLGLAVIHGIVTKLNGDITLYSEKDEGTTFRIYLPVADTAAEITQKRKREILPRGDESILLLDDDQTIAALINKILDKLGYKVKTFTNSIEALNEFKKSPDEYDLVITDMTMPHMTGDVFVTNILKLRPEVKIIMCTGFSDLINEDKAKQIGVIEYIMKPVTMDDIAFAVRRALDNK